MKKGDVVRLDGGPGGPVSGSVDFAFACPFCGKRVTGAGDGKIIFHELPYCGTFERLTVPEFVHECCVRLGLTEAGDA